MGISCVNLRVFEMKGMCGDVHTAYYNLLRMFFINGAPSCESLTHTSTWKIHSIVFVSHLLPFFCRGLTHSFSQHMSPLSLFGDCARARGDLESPAPRLVARNSLSIVT